MSREARTRRDDPSPESVASIRPDLSKLLGELALNHHPDGIMVFDASERCRLVNPRALTCLNLHADEVIGRENGAIMELALVRNQMENAAEVRDCLRRESEHPWDDLTFFLRIAGPDRVVLNRFSAPLRADDGACAGRLVVLRGMTHRDFRNDMGDAIINLVSHELRTPLTAIKGAINIMQNSPAGDSAELVQIAGRNCERLSKMLDGILDATRFLFSGKEFARDRVDLYEALLQAVAQASETAAKADIAVSMTATPRSIVVMGDRHRLEQSFSLVLDNAIKFSPPGRMVTVMVEESASGSNQTTRGEHGAVRIIVADQGPGIRPEDQERIFEPFYQPDISFSRKTGGLGLGLTICRAIVEGHGGRIRCESEPGKGSRFLIDLPREAPPDGVGQDTGTGLDTGTGEAV
jgi:signal transduction histidine kinase